MNKDMFACFMTQENHTTVSTLREVDAQFPGQIEGGATAQAGDVVLIKGIPILVVADEEAEKADAIMVQRRGPSPFKDNLFGQCAVCRAPVMYRPHAPKRPRKMCMECVEKEARRTLGASANVPKGGEIMQ